MMTGYLCDNGGVIPRSRFRHSSVTLEACRLTFAGMVWLMAAAMVAAVAIAGVALAVVAVAVRVVLHAVGRRPRGEGVWPA